MRNLAYSVVLCLADPGCTSAHAQIHRVVSSAHGAPKQWMFLNKALGPRCLATILGIGNDRLQSASHGRIDLRYRVPGEVSVNCHYQHVPISCHFVQEYVRAFLSGVCPFIN